MLISYRTHLKSKCILTINNFKIEVKYSKFWIQISIKCIYFHGATKWSNFRIFFQR